MPFLWKIDRISVVGHGHHTTKISSKNFGPRWVSSSPEFAAATAALLSVCWAAAAAVAAALVSAASATTTPATYTTCAAVRCYAGPYAAVGCYEGDRFISPPPPSPPAAPPFLSPLPSLLRLKIGGSFDGRTLWTAPPPSPPSRAVRRARRCTQPAKRPQRPPQKSTQARQSPLWSQPKEPLIGLCCYILCTNYTVVLLLPATDEIRPTTATQPTAKSS